MVTKEFKVLELILKSKEATPSYCEDFGTLDKKGYHKGYLRTLMSKGIIHWTGTNFTLTTEGEKIHREWKTIDLLEKQQVKDEDEIIFLTTKGKRKLTEIKKNNELFWETAYFDESIIKNYESDEDYWIRDEGHFLSIIRTDGKWSAGRTLYRVNKGVLSVNIGDLVNEGMPKEHLKLWAGKNIDPREVTVSDYFSDFRKSIKRLLHFMNEINVYVKNLLSGIYAIDTKDDLFATEGLEEELIFLKKFIPSKVSRTDFQSRITFLNTVIVESINTKMIDKVLKEVDDMIRYSSPNLALQKLLEENEEKFPKIVKEANFLKRPFQSLELLKRFLLFLRLNYHIINAFKIKSVSELEKRRDDIKQKVKKEFEKFNLFKIEDKDFDNKDFFIQEEKIISDNTIHMKLLNKLRSSSSAHRFNEKEFGKVLVKFGLDKDLTKLSNTYESIVSKVGMDVEHILFHLIPMHNPLIENYRKYSKKSIIELSKKDCKYEYVFEDLASYYFEFPELIEELDKEFLKLFENNKKEEKFLIYLGGFIENLSMTDGGKAQEYVDMILEKMKKVPSDIKYSLAHIGHIIKNSDKLSEDFLKKAIPTILENLTKKKDEGFMAQWCIWALYKGFPKEAKALDLKLNKNKIIFDPLKDFI